MTISTPFRRTPARVISLGLPDDLLDVVDALRVIENPATPLSRSAMLRHLVEFACALYTDEEAAKEFAKAVLAEAAEKKDEALIPLKDPVPADRTNCRD